jgi:hypothetical protein
MHRKWEERRHIKRLSSAGSVIRDTIAYLSLHLSPVFERQCPRYFGKVEHFLKVNKNFYEELTA